MTKFFISFLSQSYHRPVGSQGLFRLFPLRKQGFFIPPRPCSAGRILVSSSPAFPAIEKINKTDCIFFEIKSFSSHFKCQKFLISVINFCVTTLLPFVLQSSFFLLHSVILRHKWGPNRFSIPENLTKVGDGCILTPVFDR